MGRQWNTIIESLGPLSGGTMSINANLTEIEALLTTLQADVADGITVSSGTVTANVDFAGSNGTTAPPKVVAIGYIDSLNTGNIQQVANDGSEGLPTRIRETYIDGAGYRGLPNWMDGSSVPIDVPISGTVTANPIRGTTTTGTLTAGTTNGTLFASNSTRNYLLVQCTSGTVFIDTNGTAGTANGIQLTAGQGITFEGSFIPTGAISGITSTGTAQLIGRQG